MGTRREPIGTSSASGFRLGVAFFVGLVIALVALGTMAAILGRLLAEWRRGFAIAAAMMTVAAGIAVLFGPAFRRLVPDPPVRKGAGLVGAFTYGLVFSVATITTSAGPLILLLTVAAAMGRPLYGAALSLAYAIGRGLPFLLLATFSGHVQRWLDRFERVRRPFEIASGVALVAVAAYFVRIAAVG